MTRQSRQSAAQATWFERMLSYSHEALSLEAQVVAPSKTIGQQLLALLAVGCYARIYTTPNTAQHTYMPHIPMRCSQCSVG